MAESPAQVRLLDLDADSPTPADNPVRQLADHLVHITHVLWLNPSPEQLAQANIDIETWVRRVAELKGIMGVENDQ